MSNYRHGHSGWINGSGKEPSPEYKVWHNMKGRCLNKKDENYVYYGGRGITIDPRWYDFEAFLSDIGLRPTPQHTLERIDNNLGYSKANCIWAIRSVQARNRRNTKLTQYDVNVIRSLYATGRHKQKDIAWQFDIDQSYVSNIVRRKYWR